MAVIFNQKNLKLFIDNYNSSTGDKKIGEDNDIHHNDSHLLRV